MDFSTSSLISGLIIGSVGVFLFLYGKKAGKLHLLAGGLAMCVYPYFISNMLVLWGVTALLAAPLWYFRRL